MQADPIDAGATERGEEGTWEKSQRAAKEKGNTESQTTDTIEQDSNAQGK
jgi:hypothetical protein